MLLFPFIASVFVCIIITTSEEINVPQEEAAQYEELINQGHHIATLFTQECCSCTDCVEAEVLLGGMSQELEDNLAIIVVRLKSEELITRYGIRRLPTLIYHRENKTAIYTGEFEFDALYQWLQENDKPSTVDLDDSSFEHLTQAATGATTGDWMVLFHDGTCCKNNELMHLETAGIRMKNKVNVASVDVTKSPDTKKRFKIKQCPEIIFFRHQKLYRFSLPDVTHGTLVRFTEGFYKNAKTESVPLPQSSFDKILDMTVKFLNENWYTITTALALTIFSTIVLLFCATYKQPPSNKKSD